MSNQVSGAFLKAARVFIPGFRRDRLPDAVYEGDSLFVRLQMNITLEKPCTRSRLQVSDQSNSFMVDGAASSIEVSQDMHRACSLVSIYDCIPPRPCQAEPQDFSYSHISMQP